MQSLAYSSNNLKLLHTNYHYLHPTALFLFFETQEKSRDKRFVNITKKSKELFILEAEFPGGFFQQ